MLHTLLHLAIVNPGQGISPPGGEKVTTVIKWGAWITFAVCVLAVFFAAGRMALDHHRGGGITTHGGGLGAVLAAAIIAGSASAIVGALV